MNMHIHDATIFADRQLVHLSISSRLTREMLGSKMSSCSDSFVFIDDPVDIDGNGVIVIHDWWDFRKRKNSRFRPARSGTDSAIPDIHIIVNMIKGEEDQIPSSLIEYRNIRGLFYVEDTLETFTKGLESILNGEIWVSRTVLVNWMDCAVADNGMPAKINVLSSRQEAILKYITLGMSNMAIAKELEISSNTVKAHLYAIFKLINVSNRIQAAQWASRNLHDYYAPDSRN